LLQSAERISSKERHINKEFDHLGAEFREKQKKLDTVQEQYHTLSTSVSELTSELASKTEAVDLIANQMSDRNNSMTDTSPLRNLQCKFEC
jgi:DNA anti-recombination protein RmuC